MKGRFDDFRIYVGELTPLDVSAIYNETAAPVAGTIGALYGPTSFTATGLPSGLSIDSEGRIKGRTTAVGDHNVTIGASNLSGSASNEVITLRVAANKPVFASTENAFSPLDLSPGLWVDAADVTTITGSTSTVSQWRDKSGNNRHLNQTNASYRPTYKWNAQMDYLWLALMDPMTTWTVLDLEHLVQYLHSLSLIVIPRLPMEYY